jgi:hypothetical protein
MFYRSCIGDQIPLDEDGELTAKAHHVTVHHPDAPGAHTPYERALAAPEVLEIAAVRADVDAEMLRRHPRTLDLGVARGRPDHGAIVQGHQARRLHKIDQHEPPAASAVASRLGEDAGAILGRRLWRGLVMRTGRRRLGSADAQSLMFVHVPPIARLAEPSPEAAYSLHTQNKAIGSFPPEAAQD